MSLGRKRICLHPKILSFLTEGAETEDLLTRQQFEILQQYYIEQLSQKEIAMKYKLSTAIVRHELSKGSYILRKTFNPSEFEKAREILYGKALGKHPDSSHN